MARTFDMDIGYSDAADEDQMLSCEVSFTGDDWWISHVYADWCPYPISPCMVEDQLTDRQRNRIVAAINDYLDDMWNDYNEDY